MIVTEEKWGSIPLLHIVEENLNDKQIPVVIFLHGFTSAKEHNLHYAHNIAKKGIRVLLPDALLHGVRDEKLDETQLSIHFWEVVLKSIEEVGFLREELVKRELVGEEKIGIGGTSMGAITTLGCLTVFEWVDTAAVMMGSPGFVQLAQAQIAQFENHGFKLPITDEKKNTVLHTLEAFDLTKHVVALKQRPIYFWHGKQDTVVPFEPTYQFYEAVKEDYAAVPERIEFVSDDMAGHSVSRSGMLQAADWFACHLKG